MFRLRPMLLSTLLFSAAGIGSASAHAPLLACYDNANGTVLCEAGYSDGASSAGQAARVMSSDQRLILEGKFDDGGTFTFDMPEGDFYIEFEGDTSHHVTFYGEDLYK